MSEIVIKEASTKKDLKEFIKFPIKLYKDNACYVPPLIEFELNTLRQEKNPAFDHAEARYWMALIDGQIVGRIAAFYLNEELDASSKGRFGWVDFIDNPSVSKELFLIAENWLKEKGAQEIHGPLGFTDLDFEGALTKGFDEVATQATIYNFPYYIDHFEKLGFKPSIEWKEYRINIQGELPDKVIRLEKIIKEKYQLKNVALKKSKDVLKYAPQVFELINETFADLYGYHQLSEKQIQYYTDLYFGFVKKEFLSFVVNKNEELVGLAVTLPSFSEAFKKAKGKTFPIGFIHLLMAFKKNDIADAFLIGVRKDYQNKGVNTLIFNQLYKAYQKFGIKYFHTGPMLAHNAKVLNLWQEFPKRDTISRKCYLKKIK